MKKMKKRAYIATSTVLLVVFLGLSRYVNSLDPFSALFAAPASEEMLRVSGLIVSSVVREGKQPQALLEQTHNRSNHP